jgi:tRNA(fMet)-specific endonuclease VapC
VTVLRDPAFAAGFRPRYARDIPRTHFSSVVAQELLAGARSLQHRRQAGKFYRPFERAGRLITPDHNMWKEVGEIVARLLTELPGWGTKLRGGVLNDLLIALSARRIGATVVTRNGEDFLLIRRFSRFELEVL